MALHLIYACITRFVGNTALSLVEFALAHRNRCTNAQIIRISLPKPENRFAGQLQNY